MQQYHDLIKHVFAHGVGKKDRTGTGTISAFGYQMLFDLTDGFPLVTTKKTHLKSIIHELLWFIKNGTAPAMNVRPLQAQGVTIWDEWADEETGNLGPIYGSQWRSWVNKDGIMIDQLQNAVDTIKTDPYSRRIIVSAWNVGDLDEMALPPCHLMFQFNVRDMTPLQRVAAFHRRIKKRGVVRADFTKPSLIKVMDDAGIPDKFLDCQMYQRSGDVGLGVPFNIASYAMLTHMVAHVTDLEPGNFIHTLGDAHIYRNHINQLKELLNRVPYPLPTLTFHRPVDSIDNFIYEDFQIQNYLFHPAIKLDVSV